jgi:hypothetical protein
LTEGESGEGGDDDDQIPLERKDYIALTIAALETVLLPFVVVIVVVFLLLIVFR